MRTDTKKQFDWTGRLEQLEDRHMMSADPLGGLLGGALEHHALVDEVPALDQHVESTPDFWIESRDQTELDSQFRQIEKTLQEAHDQTGLNNVRADYGFTGIGQTVAVIDSGIAYDHFALGGGFGQDYRVVGGWDFTGENDADPYDDGPSGSHGTHVAGIVGGDSGNDTGVAPGVDLVALRVFDDAGAGYFSWVENALNWVHDNRNNFENPITAINLSLGVSGWNAESIPSWAMLEDEFAQLEADGIFIAVSAGNSFTSYNATGLSYPAASSYVIPVMSTDDSGLLSYFSQRSSRAIAAPGRWITSTVPDYSGNNNGITDDYATMSGTSMAAPYVAGASVIVREAMEFVGYTNITQDTIYNHMIATSDSFFDSETNQSYNRLNLEAAIDALMPVDDYGSTIVGAYDLGSVSDPMTMSGAIASLGDIDYFTFTAANTGTVTFEATNTTHNLVASWVVNSSQSLSALATVGDSVIVDVVAGQDYTVGFSSGDGLGFYDFDVTAEAAFTFTDWGAVSFTQMQGISATNDTWYRVEAASNGYLTIDTSFDGTGGQISLELYDTNLTQIDNGNPVNNTSRVDVYASAGNEFYVRVLGSNTDVDFRLTNLVSLSSTTVNIAGTSADDTFAFIAGTNHTVSVNGVDYSFASIAITDVNFNGGTGYDSITMTGGAGDETATLRVGDATLAGAGFTVNVLAIESVSVYGGGGVDTAYMYDTIGDDTFRSYGENATMAGDGFSNYVESFDSIYAYATGGSDRAIINDTAGDETFRSFYNTVTMTGDNFFVYARSFEENYAFATTGNDRAIMNDSAGDDTFRSWHNKATMTSDSIFVSVHSFDEIYAFATTGNDRAVMTDSAGDDTFRSWHNKATMTSDSIFVSVHSFDEIYAFATTGNDRAVMNDSAGDDTFRSWHNKATMTSDGNFVSAHSFDEAYAFATTGNDRVIMNDSSGDDTFRSYYNKSTMTGDDYFIFARSFDESYAFATTGFDRAIMNDSAGDDTFRSYHDKATMTGDGFFAYARSFDENYAFATSGYDRAIMHDSSGDDTYLAYSDKVTMSGNGFFNYAKSFDLTFAFGTQGNDFASFYDSPNDDNLFVYSWGAYLQGNNYLNQVSAFGSIRATSAAGGLDQATIEATDYLFDLVGQWS